MNPVLANVYFRVGPQAKLLPPQVDATRILASMADLAQLLVMDISAPVRSATTGRIVKQIHSRVRFTSVCGCISIMFGCNASAPPPLLNNKFPNIDQRCVRLASAKKNLAIFFREGGMTRNHASF